MCAGNPKLLCYFESLQQCANILKLYKERNFDANTEGQFFNQNLGATHFQKFSACGAGGLRPPPHTRKQIGFQSLFMRRRRKILNSSIYICVPQAKNWISGFIFVRRRRKNVNFRAYICAPQRNMVFRTTFLYVISLNSVINFT